jgi:hypothetical protein
MPLVVVLVVELPAPVTTPPPVPSGGVLMT